MIIILTFLNLQVNSCRLKSAREVRYIHFLSGLHFERFTDLLECCLPHPHSSPIHTVEVGKTVRACANLD